LAVVGAQIAFVLLIVTALAEPFWKQITGSRRELVLVLDVSASMSAAEGPSSRFEAMRSEARRMIENLRPGEQMAILSAGRRSAPSAAGAHPASRCWPPSMRCNPPTARRGSPTRSRWLLICCAAAPMRTSSS
jgi:hypothetical protein